MAVIEKGVRSFPEFPIGQGFWTGNSDVEKSVVDRQVGVVIHGLL